MSNELDTGQIKHWRSIVTLIVFVVTNIIVLFPFHIPFKVPRKVWNVLLDTLARFRVIAPRQDQSSGPKKLAFPVDFVTAPLIADLFLLAILAIGRQEVHDGTVGANNIFPIDIMVFFITLAYIAISIDASGLIRWLAFKVLQKGGKNGHLLFLYLYSFFFALSGLVGNDPVILSGTAFLAYMIRVSSNIKHPRAWIFTQFSIANIGSAILVSSNPTNLVLAGAFDIKFIHYTANMIVPVLATAILLFPFLLYIVFYDEKLVPRSITLHELDDELKKRKPINPNIPLPRGEAERRDSPVSEDDQTLSLEEIMNPFLDKKGAGFGAFIMAVTLIVILVLNAVTDASGEHPVFWVTLPAAFVMFCWDVAFGWSKRAETRKIAREGREKVAAQAITADDGIELAAPETEKRSPASKTEPIITQNPFTTPEASNAATPASSRVPTNAIKTDEELGEKQQPQVQQKTTLVSMVSDGYRWSQETFPTVTAVLGHLPYKLVPFAFCMFVLVQALATKGWVAVFAHGWDHWVDKTGTIGAIGGMGFLSVIMCNFAGTNIGTTILLCRVVQAWTEIHRLSGIPITERTFWATVYSMAIGVNYGAFSAAFSAALAGLLWRDILERKKIHVSQSQFARYNLPIIAVAMAVGCAVLVGEVYIIRGQSPYVPGGG